MINSFYIVDWVPIERRRKYKRRASASNIEGERKFVKSIFVKRDRKIKTIWLFMEMYCLLVPGRDGGYGNDTLSNGLLIYAMAGEKIVNAVEQVALIEVIVGIELDVVWF